MIHALSFAISHYIPLPIQALPFARELSLSVLLPVALTFSLTILSVAHISFAFTFPLTLALTLPHVPLLSFPLHVPHHYSFFYPGLFAEGGYILPAAVAKTSRRIPSLRPPVFRPYRFWHRCLAFPDGLVVYCWLAGWSRGRRIRIWHADRILLASFFGRTRLVWDVSLGRPLRCIIAIRFGTWHVRDPLGAARRNGSMAMVQL